MPALIAWRTWLALALALAMLSADPTVTLAQPRSAATVPTSPTADRPVWQQYRWLIAAVTVTVVSAQMVLIAALLRQRRRRRLAEKALLSREAGLRVSYRRTQQLARNLIHAQETARIALARDLHDDIGQDIIGVALAIDRFTHSSGRIDDERNQHALLKLYERAVAVADQVRLISHELHPATLQLLGLIPAVKAHCLEVEARCRTRVALKITGEMNAISSNSALCLFRIAQEGLRNASVHGKAPHVEISLTRFGDDIELIVWDDGCGFDVDSTRQCGHGLGLVTMEERVHTSGGEVIVRSIPGAGTTVLACVPAGVVSTAPADVTNPVALSYAQVVAGASLTALPWHDQVC